MLAFSSRKKGGGSNQQPLSYLDSTLPAPNAPAGKDLLGQHGLVVRPVISRQDGGASVQQPLAYLDPTLPVPSAPAGSDLLRQTGLILRPVIPRQAGGAKGGFLPSVMKGVVNSGVIVAPLAAIAARRMWSGTRKKGGGKKEDWARNRDAAKSELSKYGKPSALNVNKFAALQRKNQAAAEEWLTEYIVRKRATAKKGKKGTVKTVKVDSPKTSVLWKNLVDRAKQDLAKFGKPSGANAAKFASLKKKGENTTAFLTNFKTRKAYKSPTKTGKNQYQANLAAARQHLSQFGKPTVANVSKFVSLKRKSESTKAIENAVKSRVKPKTVAATAIKATAKSPPPSTLNRLRRNLANLQKKILSLEGKKK